MGRNKFEAYSHRNINLKSLGFDSYAAYLDSPLWAGIREKVLKAAKYKCCACPNKASQCHHKSYLTHVLLGRDLRQIVAICRDCHEKIEFKGKKKASLKQANKALRRMTEPQPAKSRKRKKQPRYSESGSWSDYCKDTAHQRFMADKAWANKNLHGRKRDVFIAEARRKCSAAMNGMKLNPDLANKTMTTAVSLARHTREIDIRCLGKSPGVGTGEQSPVQASGKSQSNAARTQGLPIPLETDPVKGQRTVG